MRNTKDRPKPVPGTRQMTWNDLRRMQRVVARYAAKLEEEIDKTRRKRVSNPPPLGTVIKFSKFPKDDDSPDSGYSYAAINVGKVSGAFWTVDDPRAGDAWYITGREPNRVYLDGRSRNYLTWKELVDFIGSAEIWAVKPDGWERYSE